MNKGDVGQGALTCPPRARAAHVLRSLTYSQVYTPAPRENKWCNYAPKRVRGFCSLSSAYLSTSTDVKRVPEVGIKKSLSLRQGRRRILGA